MRASLSLFKTLRQPKISVEPLLPSSQNVHRFSTTLIPSLSRASRFLRCADGLALKGREAALRVQRLLHAFKLQLVRKRRELPPRVTRDGSCEEGE